MNCFVLIEVKTTELRWLLLRYLFFKPELDNWEKFVPEIKASFAQPGIMEVYWNAPPDGIKNSLDGYKVRLVE